MQLSNAQAQTIRAAAALFYNRREFEHKILYRLHRMRQPITDNDVQKVIHSCIGITPIESLQPISVIVYPRLGAPMLGQT